MKMRQVSSSLLEKDIQLLHTVSGNVLLVVPAEKTQKTCSGKHGHEINR